MNFHLIDKVLGKLFPEDILRSISSYFIQKLLKDEMRCLNIQRLLCYRRLYVIQGFHPDLEFRYNLVCFRGSLQKYLIVHVFPKLFIEYHFCIGDRISSIRFWIPTNRIEIPVDGYWVEQQPPF